MNDHFKVSLKASQAKLSGDSSTLVESVDANKDDKFVTIKAPKENIVQSARSGSKTDRNSRAGSIKTGKDEQSGIKKEYTLNTLDSFLRSKNIASK